MMELMASRSNRSALAATMQALREAERVGPVDSATVRLAETLASKLDGMVDGGEKGYSVAAVAKAYHGVLETLRAASAPPVDGFEELLSELSRPTHGAAPTDGAGW
jgi:hypothetical protein